MQVSIAPTVTADNPHTYREQLERAMTVADRIHVDFADGDLAPTKLVPPIQAWLPEEKEIDLHVMYQNPGQEIEQLISLKPKMIILHAESSGNILGMLREIKTTGIRAGVAFLQNTQPEDYANEIEEADHVLIFGGKLGYHGGEADLSMLDKVVRVKQINSEAEIGWDGGANDQNIGKLIAGGINVVNVGSFVQKAEDPQAAYAILESVVN